MSLNFGGKWTKEITISGMFFTSWEEFNGDDEYNDNGDDWTPDWMDYEYGHLKEVKFLEMKNVSKGIFCEKWLTKSQNINNSWNYIIHTINNKIVIRIYKNFTGGNPADRSFMPISYGG